MLADSTPNDGSFAGACAERHRARRPAIKVEAIGNVFFDVSDADVTLGRRADHATVGGSVPATLSLTLGAPASFGAFTPGVDEGLRRELDGERHLDRR